MKASKSAARIREAYLSLLDEFPQGPITVTQIAQRAHVNRITFYRLYETKEAVLEDILDGFAEENDEYFDQIQPEGSFQNTVVRASLEHHKRHMPTLRTILNSYMRSVYVQDVEEGIRGPMEGMPAEQLSGIKAMLVSFYVAGISRVICDWIQGGCKESVDEVLAFLEATTIQAKT